MAIASNHIFKPIPSNSNLAEAFSELFQDNDRSGFQNLGSGDSHIVQTVTADQFINAQGGKDSIWLEGNTNDTIFGGSGDDNIDGGAGNDTLSGGSGNDTIFGGAGADRISGGSGDDYLAGDNDAVPFSQHGVDTINGGSGNDTVYGGGGADILTGGTGNDTFVYYVGVGAENESKVGAADHITDFQTGDKIDVSFMDADGNAANGNSAFTFSANGPSTQAGTYWFEQHDDGQHVFFNINGGAADMEIISDNGHVFTASDFHL
jgi:Ca2+-binding RTX toxin-like protein